MGLKTKNAKYRVCNQKFPVIRKSIGSSDLVCKPKLTEQCLYTAVDFTALPFSLMHNLLLLVLETFIR